MSRRTSAADRARTRLLEAWEPPPTAGDPVGLVASTFTFDAAFFEEELLARFLTMETSVDDGRLYLLEREDRLGKALAVVLGDRRHVSRSTTLAWDLLPVPVPRQACQHAKVSLLVWEDWTRLIIGSANLTEPAYRRNLEVVTVLDFHEASVTPRYVLLEAIRFLRRVTSRVPDPEGTRSDAPAARAVGLLDEIARRARRLDLPEDWPRKVVRLEPIFLEPGRGPGVIDAMGEPWGDGTRPNEVSVLSPFWAEPDAQGRDPVIPALVEAMGVRGDRVVEVLVPGEEESEGRWLVDLPAAVAESEEQIPRLEVGIYPIPMRQAEEARPLHAKVVRWRRTSERKIVREILLAGSSNASQSGLGIGTAPRNIEANLCFVGDGETSTIRWFEACFPRWEDPDSLAFRGSVSSKAGEEGGAPPVPEFFRWAALDREGSELKVVLGLGGADEPDAWEVRVPQRKLGVTRMAYGAGGRPSTWELPVPGAESAPPVLVEVRWETDAGPHLGHLPVNALTAAGRARSDLWADVDLETLLEALARGGSLYRRLAQILQKRERMFTHEHAAELDPHRRVDTSGFLMPRMRRISQALEGLYERLAQPVASEAALEWRFGGPVSPRFLAERLVDSVGDATEARFLVTEIALVVARAAKRVEAVGLRREVVRARYRRAGEDLAEVLPSRRGPADSPLDQYVEAAWAEARA